MFHDKVYVPVTPTGSVTESPDLLNLHPLLRHECHALMIGLLDSVNRYVEEFFNGREQIFLPFYEHEMQEHAMKFCACTVNLKNDKDRISRSTDVMLCVHAYFILRQIIYETFGIELQYMVINERQTQRIKNYITECCIMVTSVLGYYNTQMITENERYIFHFMYLLMMALGCENEFYFISCYSATDFLVELKKQQVQHFNVYCIHLMTTYFKGSCE